jgi:hypothetical protein
MVPSRIVTHPREHSLTAAVNSRQMTLQVPTVRFMRLSKTQSMLHPGQTMAVR